MLKHFTCLLQPASSMATYGYKRQFILLDNTPQVTGKTGTNPHVQCSICGFQFYGGTARQKAHLRRITGNGVRPCSEVEEKALELVAELEHEMHQEQRQKELQQKRAASSSSASASKPSKQQKLESGFARQSKALVDAEVAAFFYAEGIPFAKVGRR